MEMIKLHNSSGGEIPPREIETEDFKVSDQDLIQKAGGATNQLVPLIKQENNLLGFEDVTNILKDLCLSYVVVGDYVIIMNNREDVTFSGEPYIALQVWFNTRTGKIMCRVWNETIANDRIVTDTQLRETCISHLQGRP